MNIQVGNKSYQVFVDSGIVDNNEFNKEDLDFLLEQELITPKPGKKVKIKFVGEIITPSGNIIALPKNFEITKENLELTKIILNKYKNLKKDGKVLITNKSFSVSDDAEIKSDAFYFNKLKNYFMDYITYEFIYPKKLKEIHSRKPLKGFIDPIKTDVNFEKTGDGVTYKIKDIKNNKNWNLDDIYYTTLIKLAKLYGNDKELKQIEDMKDFLIEKGYEINIDEKILQDQTPVDNIIKNIKKTEINGKHIPIKNTLLNYYKSSKIINKNIIYAFYSQYFCKVWEYFTQIALQHNESFKRHIEMEFPKIYRDIQSEEDEEGEDFQKYYPDILSDYKGHRFIGDSKYYSQIEDDYKKEMYQYNESTGNIYPMVIFVPVHEETKYHGKIALNKFELIIIKLSLKDTILDVINKTTVCIDKTHEILPKVTKRWR